MAIRTSFVALEETPISSQKYNTELDDVYAHLTDLETFNTGENPPDVLTDWAVWYDSNYNPPLEKRWNPHSSSWQWTGVLIFHTGDQMPPEAPMKGAIRMNAETGISEYYDGTAWIAIQIQTDGPTFSGAGSYIWQRNDDVPYPYYLPKVGYGYDRYISATQSSGQSDGQRDIFVIGGSNIDLKSSMMFSVNSGQTWQPVANLQALANANNIDPNAIVCVEQILGYNNDFSIEITNTPFIWALVKLNSTTVAASRILVSIRVTDQGPNLAGTATQIHLIDSAESNIPHSMDFFKSVLRVSASSQAPEGPKFYDFTWNAATVSLDGVTSATLVPGRLTSGCYIRNTDSYTATFSDGRLAWATNGDYNAVAGPGVSVAKMFDVSWDQRLAALSSDGKRLMYGSYIDPSLPPVWTTEPDFTAGGTIYDMCISGIRGGELAIGQAIRFDLPYGCIFENKMGASDYTLVWQNDHEDDPYSIVYSGRRNRYMILGIDRDTMNLVATYNSDMVSISEYFKNINNQIQSLVHMVNVSMKQGGIRKNQVLAWKVWPYSSVLKAPEGFDVCDGRYSEELGTNTPDLTGRFIVGTPKSISVGSTIYNQRYGGAEGKTLNVSNMPSHFHKFVDYHTHGFSSATIVSRAGSHSHNAWEGYPMGATIGGQEPKFVLTTGLSGANVNSYSSANAGAAVSVARLTQLHEAPSAFTSDANPWWLGGGHTHTISGTTGSNPNLNQSTEYSGSSTPFAFDIPYYSMVWVIATRDHTSADGIYAGFLSPDQLQAIDMASAPTGTNAFATMDDLANIPPGPSGKSAYELAQLNGFVGSLQEWLLSLQGPLGMSAYEVARLEGFTGSQSDWVQSLIGADGKSAYQVALDNGFVGTEADWLASLVGAEGLSAYEVAMAGGFIGTLGDWLDSLVGAQGESAYQVAVENGFTGSESDWLVSLIGKSAYEVAVENGFTDTETAWLASLKGADGDDGDTPEMRSEDGWIEYKLTQDTAWKKLIHVNQNPGSGSGMSMNQLEMFIPGLFAESVSSGVYMAKTQRFCSWFCGDTYLLRAHVRCSVSGITPPTIALLHNGVEVAGSAQVISTSFYEIEFSELAIQVYDADVFDVIVKDPGSGDSENLSVVVVLGPMEVIVPEVPDNSGSINGGNPGMLYGDYLDGGLYGGSPSMAVEDYTDGNLYGGTPILP